MKGIEQDLHADAGDRNEANPGDEFDGLIDDSKMTDQEREIWALDHRSYQHKDDHDHNLLDIDGNDASIFYGDFSPLPDFPCMSSSSSSSSTPVKPIIACSSYASTASSNSSSAASWAVLKHEDSNNHQLVDGTPAAALSSTASMEIPQPSDQNVMMDVMESFGYIDHLLDDNNDFFGPCSIFHHTAAGLEDQFQQDQKPQQQEHEQVLPMIFNTKNNEDHQNIQTQLLEEKASEDDLAMVFLEWLKTNKESVSAEDLRKVKIKKATIECAAKRLGGGKEAMKQLLKLILEWVQNNHLQKRRNIKELSADHDGPPFQNQNLNNCNSVLPPNSCFSHQPTWIQQPAAAVMVPGFVPVNVGYMGEPLPFANVNSYPYQPPTENYRMLDSAQTWPASQFALANSHYNNSFPVPVPDNNNLPAAAPVPQQPAGFGGYGNQYPNQYVHPGHNNDQRLVRLGSSATKEARKKRMARQRRFAPHHRNHNNNHQSHLHQDQSLVDQRARLMNDQCSVAAAASQANHPGNWIYWPPVEGGGGVATNPPVLPAGEVAMMHHPVDRTYQRQLASDKRQGWKPEKNLRFLLQKVLKQSDVGNLGRIVLPKKEAEIHLPGLETRDGISIDMEDIGTSRVWNMRYRFWPNNKSRMYLLENTGDFVRTNGLQEGDFIVIYSDVKCGKYLIRGVKVRQSGPKSESKRPGKTQKNQHATSPAAAAAAINGSASTPIKQTVK